MRKILLCAAFLIGVTGAKAQPADSYLFTLENCIDYAMGNSYTRQSMRLSQDAAQTVYELSRLERLPSLAASAGENYSDSRTADSRWSGSADLSTSVALYRGGSVSATINQNKLRSEQSVYNTAQYDNLLTIRILQSFLSVLGNEELLKYQQSVVEASAQQARQGEAQLKAGSILPSDYLLLESQLASDRNNIEDTRIARDNSLLTLKGLLSMRPSANLTIVYPDSTTVGTMSVLPSMDYVLDRATATLPELKVSAYDIDIASKNLQIARSAYLPSLTASAGAGTGHSPDFDNLGRQLSDGVNGHAGLSLSVPIFNNGRTRTKVAQGRIALQQAELAQKQTEIDAMQTVAVQYQDVTSAWNKFNTTNIRQNAYLRTFEAYRAQFNAGAITAVDLLQQQNNYIGALNDFIQSKYGFILKRKILDVYMGEKITM